MECYTFRITEICDKNCETCCCKKSKAILNPDLLLNKLKDIKVYHQHNNLGRVTIILTGGEPFFYKIKTRNNNIYNIIELLKDINQTIPGCRIIIKTSGWKNHIKLNSILKQVYFDFPRIILRIGFNLYQNNGSYSDERLFNMISLILNYQNEIKIETIYDKKNISETFKVITKVLKRFYTPEIENLERREDKKICKRSDSNFI